MKALYHLACENKEPIGIIAFFAALSLVIGAIPFGGAIWYFGWRNLSRDAVALLSALSAVVTAIAFVWLLPINILSGKRKDQS